MSEQTEIMLTVRIAELQMEIARLLLAAEGQKRDGAIVEAVATYENLVGKCGQHKDAIEALRRLNPLSPVEWLPGTMTDAMCMLADLYETLRETDKSAKTWATIDEIGRSLGGFKEIDLLESYAVQLQNQGRYNEAMTRFYRCEEYYSKENHTIRGARIASRLAEILEWLGDNERSLIYATKAYDLITPEFRQIMAIPDHLAQSHRRVELTGIYSQVLNTLGRIHRHNGDYNSATRCFTDLEAISEEEVKVAVRYHLDFVRVLEKDFDNAIVSIESNEKKCTGRVRPKLGVFYSLKAEALLGAKKPGSALQWIDAALLEFTRYPDPEAESKALWRKARILMSLDNFKDALTSCEKAIRLVDGMRKTSLGYRIDNLFLKDKMPLMIAGINLASRAGDADLCAYFMEIIKSRTLSTMLSIPKAQRQHHSELEKKVAIVSGKIDRLEFVDYDQAQHISLTKEREALMEKIRITDPRWETITSPPAFDPGKLQRTLGARNQAVISLFMNGNIITTVLITGHGSEVDVLAVDNDCIGKLNRYCDNLSSQEFNPSMFDFSNSFRVDITRFIPEKIIQKAAGFSSVIFVPHNDLHLVPWAGMRYNDRFFFEYTVAGLAPNLACITGLDFEFTKDPRIAVIGAPAYEKLDNLEDAISELNDVQAIYANRIIDRVRIGKDSNVENFWRLAGHPGSDDQIFHVACHGALDPDDPHNASLIFSDGKVDMASLMLSRQIRYAEVVLSACSTGFRPGKVGNLDLVGDDILNIPGSMLEAGVRSVLVSITPAADDVTRKFIVSYHQNRKSMSPLKAFRQTQLAMLKEKDCPVSLWIGFTMYSVI